ncbi:Transcription factor tga7 [Thalictrum thalictroides]|uniref:Transcription factor tga7 n=1 Tax=Thalictrum thalictroides TaxID=46969 RepID=A0A7J6WR41_THATH|nr:Transcription factor tga7 [Thalictrum thalictroides]
MSSDRCSFKYFFEEWTGRQQYFLDQLISSQNLDEDELKGIIAQVLGNYQQYYEAKAKAAREDVFSLFLPTWISTYERTFLWITGFKPGLAFNVVNNSVKDLSQVQLKRMDKLKAETRVKEKELSNELARIQESIAVQNLVKMTRELGKQLDVHVNDVLEELRKKMEIVVQSADYLRMWTAREIVEILNLRQSVRFLGSTTQFQIRLRLWGKQRDMMNKEETKKLNLQRNLFWKFLDF